MKIFVKPTKPGAVVRLPQNPTSQVPPEGAWVKRNAYWLRRLRDGSVIETDPPQEQDGRASRKTETNPT
jgi:Protein of unknown function (DUF2635)